jgi:hypothetical protein
VKYNLLDECDPNTPDPSTELNSLTNWHRTQNGFIWRLIEEKNQHASSLDVTLGGLFFCTLPWNNQ